MMCCCFGLAILVHRLCYNCNWYGSSPFWPDSLYWHHCLGFNRRDNFSSDMQSCIIVYNVLLLLYGMSWVINLWNHICILYRTPTVCANYFTLETLFAAKSQDVSRGLLFRSHKVQLNLASIRLMSTAWSHLQIWKMAWYGPLIHNIFGCCLELHGK